MKMGYTYFSILVQHGGVEDSLEELCNDNKSEIKNVPFLNKKRTFEFQVYPHNNVDFHN